MLGRSGEADECLEKACDGRRHHHFPYQLRAARRTGCEVDVRRDFESDKMSLLALDASICAEMLGIGNLFNTPHLLVFLMERLGRVVVSETALTETRNLVERKSLGGDRHVQEVLTLLEAVLVDVEGDPAVLDGLAELQCGAIAEGGGTCLAWWDGKGRWRVKTGRVDGKVVKPEKESMKKIYDDASGDRRIVSEAAAVSAALSCRVYLLTSDLDITLFAGGIHELTAGGVRPVRPGQIMWDP